MITTGGSPDFPSTDSDTVSAGDPVAAWSYEEGSMPAVPGRDGPGTHPGADTLTRVAQPTTSPRAVAPPG